MTFRPHVTDLALARRLERAEGSANAAFVESRALHAPALGATWSEVGGTYAMFDGVGSPLTQTFGLGLFAAPSADDLQALEDFFRARGAEVFHEVSPLADPALLPLLSGRGYHPIELTTVLRLPLDDASPPAVSARPPVAGLTTRRIDSGELSAWAEGSARGWGEYPELAAFMRDFGTVTGSSRGVSCFVAELEGEIIATGAIAIHGGVALLAGASTIPAWRGRGAQGALLAARLAYARAEGCDLAMMGAAPGSTSQANAERQGFRIAYTRIKWQLAA
ncbi:MAG: GNAT family N-acetyltransferase [Gemmatimonadetes bacterium]|nr:GNAT family N-acetyltransferase [Gemmatimonadota bacterium]MBK9980460.1 GNAT family N-acetyltransferase [Gemmatimonadota bacterium]